MNYPLLLFVIGATVFAHLTYAHFRFESKQLGEILYHQRLTGQQIEDEIRRIRREDWPIREKASKL